MYQWFYNNLWNQISIKFHSFQLSLKWTANVCKKSEKFFSFQMFQNQTWLYRLTWLSLNFFNFLSKIFRINLVWNLLQNWRIFHTFSSFTFLIVCNFNYESISWRCHEMANPVTLIFCYHFFHFSLFFFTSHLSICLTLLPPWFVDVITNSMTLFSVGLC